MPLLMQDFNTHACAARGAENHHQQIVRCSKMVLSMLEEAIFITLLTKAILAEADLEEGIRLVGGLLHGLEQGKVAPLVLLDVMAHMGQQHQGQKPLRLQERSTSGSSCSTACGFLSKDIQRS